MDDRMDELPQYPAYAERVLEVAELIPPGRVMTYGDVAEWLGEGGPRQVGRAMALYGGAVPWWRVVRADGVLLPGHELRALDHYRAEGTPLRDASRVAEGHLPRLDMKRARWDGVERRDAGPGGAVPGDVPHSEGAHNGAHIGQLPPNGGAAGGPATVRGT
jgi:alkylated DNA nucleotide flippase Atl1